VTLEFLITMVLISHYVVLHFTGGCQIEGEDDSWDFGTGAGFYVDATEDKWKTNYRMYSYVTKEVVGTCVSYVQLIIRH